MAKTFKNFISGEWVKPSAKRYFENRNPANWSEVLGRFPESGIRDVKRAIKSAERGFRVWSKTPVPLRGEVLRAVGDLLVERKEEIARTMTSEMGKVLEETRGDASAASGS